MSTPIIKTEYDTLETVAVRFDQQADGTEKMVRTLLMILEPLEQSGWEGDAAQAFFREMNNEVLPATNRLKSAMTDGSDTVRQIIQAMQTAEAQAAALFQDDMKGGNGGTEQANNLNQETDGVRPAPPNPAQAQQILQQISGVISTLGAAGINIQDVKEITSAATSLAKGEISGQEFLERVTSILPELSVAGVTVDDVSTVASSVLQLANGEISPSDFINSVSGVLPIAQPIRDFFGDGYTVSGEYSASDEVWGGEWDGSYGQLDISALGYNVDAEGQVTLSWEDGVNMSGSFEAEAHLIDLEYEAEFGPVDVNAHVYVGANASGAGEFIFDPRNGVYELSLEGELGAYFSAGAEVGVDLGILGEVSVDAGVGGGIGIHGHADASYKDGVLSLDFGGGLFLGIGGEFNVNLDIDIGAAVDAVKDFGQGIYEGAKEFVNTLSEGVDDIIEKGGEIIEDVVDFVEDAKDFIEESPILPWNWF